MSPPSALAPAVLERARADQVAQLYAGWHRTTVSMLLGAALLCLVLWSQLSPAWIVVWLALIAANQAWRGLLARAWTRRQPGAGATRRWGRYWTVGSTLAGALWGLAAIVVFPPSAAHQALLIVCMFGVVLGGLNLTAVYRPAFYGFVLPALVAAHRAGGARRRRGAPLHGPRDERGGRVRARVRRPVERPDDALARDALRERRPHRRAQGAVARRARGTRRRRRPPTAPRASCSRRRVTTCASRCMRSASTRRRSPRAPAPANGIRWWAACSAPSRHWRRSSSNCSTSRVWRPAPSRPPSRA